MVFLEQLNFFESVIEFLSYEMNQVPTIYGWFHIMFLIIIAVITIICIKRFKGATNIEINKFLRTTAVIMLIFEVYKQFVFTIEGSIWDYQWYAFPFQFCSVPMYLMFLASFLKDGNMRKNIISFLGTYNVFAGLAVMIYPSDVFINTLGISIQTMVHHGLMVVVGITLLATNQIPFQRKEIFRAALVFGVLGLIAFVMNIALVNVDGTFNMFFISPYYDTHLPVLSIINESLGYIPYLITYFFGFTLVAYLVLLVAIFINKKILTSSLKEKVFLK